MKATLTLALFSMLIAGIAAADPIDPDPNSMGIYFDSDATICEIEASPFSFVDAYFILTNPDFNTLIGYEFGYYVTGPHRTGSWTWMGDAPIDVGDYVVVEGSTVLNAVVSLGSPMVTTQATTIAVFEVIVLGLDPIEYTLYGIDPNDMTVLPRVRLVDDTTMSIGLSSYWADSPQICASINGTGVVATDTANWDQIKALYR